MVLRQHHGPKKQDTSLCDCCLNGFQGVLFDSSDKSSVFASAEEHDLVRSVLIAAGTPEKHVNSSRGSVFLDSVETISHILDSQINHKVALARPAETLVHWQSPARRIEIQGKSAASHGPVARRSRESSS